MSKRLWVGFVAVLLGFYVMDYVIHSIVLKPIYDILTQDKVFRPAGESKAYVFLVVRFLQCLVLAFVFSRYEAKGIIEGIRFGIYFGVMVALSFAYASYAMFPIPYKLAMQWFIYEVLEFAVAGIILSIVWSRKEERKTWP